MNKKRVAGLATLLMIGILSFWTQRMTLAGGQGKAGGRVFELRTYHTNPGKLSALHARFRNHTNPLFVKYGMQLIGFWNPTEGDGAGNTLIYMLAYPSREAREKAWKGFMSDPAWKKAYAESRKNGPLVRKVENRFLTAADYSPIQ